jgi:hypothetical protein
LVLERRFLRPESLLPLVHAEVLCFPEKMQVKCFYCFFSTGIREAVTFYFFLQAVAHQVCTWNLDDDLPTLSPDRVNLSLNLT